MNFLDRQFGRLGNRMFQTAFFYSYARDKGIDFYYQDPKWFERYADEIRTIFGEGIGERARVSIHIRRGDYVDNPFYTDLTKTDYYHKAIEMFRYSDFLVFSDDMEFARSFILGIDSRNGFDFYYEDDESIALKEMASCKHNIIANSSFSWWAAYLNPNPGKKVIAPKNWHPDGVERTVCPKEWIRI